MNKKPCPRNSCQGGYGDCLDVKFTNACNGACEFCIEKDGYSPEPAPINVLIGHAIADPAPTVLILGGEPLMAPVRVMDFIEGIRPYKDKIYLTTNGCFLSTMSISRLAGYLNGINISVHHYNEARNQDCMKTSVPVKFDELRQHIRKLQDKDCPVRLNVNLVKGFIDSYEEATKMLAFAEEMGVSSVRFTELQNVGDDLFVDAKEVFDQLADVDPWTDGCEQRLKHRSLKVTVKIGCGHVVASRPKPPCDGKSSCRVMYPNGEITEGWVKPKPELVWKPDPTCRPGQDSEDHSGSFDCHGFSCHY